MQYSSFKVRYCSRAGFSAFELLCVIIIVAIVAGVGVRYMGHITQRQCILHLKSKLSHTQYILSAYYADSFIRGDSISMAHARNVFHQLTLNPKQQCAFVLQDSTLIAHIGAQNVVFRIDPPNLAINPKISCVLSAPLCKELGDRILDK